RRWAPETMVATGVTAAPVPSSAMAGTAAQREPASASRPAAATVAMRGCSGNGGDGGPGIFGGTGGTGGQGGTLAGVPGAAGPS
ncbi:hypothetical protein OSI80_01210, partial [Mycobacterium ulcerans]